MYPGKTGPFIMALGHDFWSNYHDPNGFVLGEYRDPGHCHAFKRKLSNRGIEHHIYILFYGFENAIELLE